MESAKKIMLQCDYTEGAHPNIINKLVETNLLQTEDMEKMKSVKKPKNS